MAASSGLGCARPALTISGCMVCNPSLVDARIATRITICTTSKPRTKGHVMLRTRHAHMRMPTGCASAACAPPMRRVMEAPTPSMRTHRMPLALLDPPLCRMGVAGRPMPLCRSLPLRAHGCPSVWLAMLMGCALHCEAGCGVCACGGCACLVRQLASASSETCELYRCLMPTTLSWGGGGGGCHAQQKTKMLVLVQGNRQQGQMSLFSSLPANFVNFGDGSSWQRSPRGAWWASSIGKAQAHEEPKDMAPNPSITRRMRTPHSTSKRATEPMHVASRMLGRLCAPIGKLRHSGGGHSAMPMRRMDRGRGAYQVGCPSTPRSHSRPPPQRSPRSRSQSICRALGRAILPTRSASMRDNCV